MTIKIGDLVLVQDILDGLFYPATVAGWYDRKPSQLDYTESYVIAEAGRVYSVRYKDGLGTYNAHESRIAEIEDTKK